MIEIRLGRIVRLERHRPGCIRAWADVTGDTVPVLAYDRLTGPLAVGDIVQLNTTAVRLGLGTGGTHFVMAVAGRQWQRCGDGHIVKVRYTPIQHAVLALEEPSSPHHHAIQSFQSLEATPVVVASLHSMVAPIALTYKSACGAHTKVAYVMTDGGALPAPFSALIGQLKDRGLIDQVITCGHAFGGDLEAVTPYSALAAARVVVRADLVIVAMGPGIVGTSTRWGTTGLELAPLLDAAGALGGRPIGSVRLSLTDPRPRQRGVSHHALTALGRLTHRRVKVPMPRLPDPHEELVRKQLEDAGVMARHDVEWWDARVIHELLDASGLNVTSMGRDHRQDPGPFLAGAAAGLAAADLPRR